MSIMNQHVGKMLVGPHAQERWRERSVKESLRESLERAMPFGGQYGDNLLLIDGEVVFACEKYGSAYFVKTVLTKDQAVANMEFAAGGHRVYDTSSKETNAKKKANITSERGYDGGLVAIAIPPQDALFARHNPSIKKKPVKDVLKEVCVLFKKSDADLELEKSGSLNGRWKEVISQIQKLKQRTPLAVDDVVSLFGKNDEDLQAVIESDNSKISHIANSIMAQRNRIKKQKNHAERMQNDLASLKKAMREFLPPEIVAQIYHLSNSTRDSEELSS